MEKQPYDIDLLDKYLADTISESELEELQSQFESSEAFEQEVKLQRILLEGVQSAGNHAVVADIMPIVEQELQEDGLFGSTSQTNDNQGGIIGMLGDIEGELEEEGYFEKVKEEVKPNEAKVRRLIPTWVKGVAAAVAIALIALGIDSAFNSNVASMNYADEALKATFEMEKNQALSVAAGIKPEVQGFQEPIPEQKKILKDGIEAFHAGNIADALEKLQEVDTNYPDYEMSNYYLALCYMQKDKKFKEANDLLSKNIYQRFKGNAKWFKALCLLKLGQDKAAKDLVKEVAQGTLKSDYLEKAKKLLKHLE